MTKRNIHAFAAKLMGMRSLAQTRTRETIVARLYKFAERQGLDAAAFAGELRACEQIAHDNGDPKLAQAIRAGRAKATDLAAAQGVVA